MYNGVIMAVYRKRGWHLPLPAEGWYDLSVAVMA